MIGSGRTIGAEQASGTDSVARAKSSRKLWRTIVWVLLSVGLLAGIAATGLYLFLAAMHREAREEAIHIALQWDARTAYLSYRRSRGERIHEDWYAQRAYGGICGIRENTNDGQSCPEFDLIPGAMNTSGEDDRPRCTPVLIRGDLDQDAGARLYSIVDLQHTHRLLRENPVSGSFSHYSVGLPPPPWARGEKSSFTYNIEPSGMCGSVFVYTLTR